MWLLNRTFLCDKFSFAVISPITASPCHSQTCQWYKHVHNLIQIACTLEGGENRLHLLIYVNYAQMFLLIISDSGSCRAKYSLTIGMTHIWIINAAQTPYCSVLHHSFSAYLSYYFPSLSFTQLTNSFLSQSRRDFNLLFQDSNTSTLLKQQSFLACLLLIYTSTSVTCHWRAWIEKTPSLSTCAVIHTLVFLENNKSRAALSLLVIFLCWMRMALDEAEVLCIL